MYFFKITFLSIVLSSLFSMICKGDEVQYKKGQLDNGMTYYICHTEAKKDKASFYLMQKVGAILEEDHENGLSHFLEHMAFNGTKNFSNGGIVGFLKRNNVPSFNAYTSTNETVYHFEDVNLGTTSLDSCLCVLKDWSAFLNLEESEIDAERGVIVEEARTRKSNLEQYHTKIKGFKLNHSKYEFRDVIGSMDVVKNHTYKELRDYYAKWYKPQFQGIVIIGDVDINDVEQRIIKEFAYVPKDEKNTKLPEVIIEDNEGVLFHQEVNEYLEKTKLSISYRVEDKMPSDRVAFAKFNFYNRIFNDVLRKRLVEVLNQNQDIIRSTYGKFVQIEKGYSDLTIEVVPNGNNFEAAFRLMYKEYLTLRKYGLTEKELTYLKTSYTEMSQKFKEKDFNYYTLFKDNFFLNRELAGFNSMLDTQKDLISKLSNTELIAWMDANIEHKNLFISNSSNKADTQFLTKDEVVGLITDLSQSNLERKKENKLARIENLIDFDVKSEKTKTFKKIKSLDAYKIKLANGAKLYYKKIDSIGMGNYLIAVSKGGLNALGSDELHSASALPSIISNSGVYKYDKVQLDEFLERKHLSAKFDLKNNVENFSFTSDDKSCEDLFKLSHLYFAKPRFDKQKYDYMIEYMIHTAQNKRVNPYQFARDSVDKVTFKDFGRKVSDDQKGIESISFNTIQDIYKKKTSDVKSFTFVMVGNLPVDSIEHLANKYVGSLSSVKNKEKEKVYDEFIYEGDHDYNFEVKGIGDKANMLINFYNTEKLKSADKLYIGAVKDALKERLRLELREKMSATYNINVNLTIKEEPYYLSTLSIFLQTSKDRFEEIKSATFKVINDLKENGLTQEEFATRILKPKNHYLIDFENREAEPSKPILAPNYWLKALQVYAISGVDITKKKPELNKKYLKAVDSANLLDVKTSFAKFLDSSKKRNVYIKTK